MDYNRSIFQLTFRRSFHLRRVLGSAAGTFCAIGLIAYLTEATGQLVMIPPFGATCVILFAMPDSRYARPLPVIGGHVFSALTGLVCLHAFGAVWWSYAAAVSGAFVFMQLTSTLHPPAAADPVFILMQQETAWDFLLMPVLAGSVLLVVCAMVCHIVRKHIGCDDQ